MVAAEPMKLPIDDGCGQWPVGVGKGLQSPGYSGVHDLGGVDALLKGPLDVRDKPVEFWERQTHALVVSLIGAGKMKVDEMRRTMEHLHPEQYASWLYYEKWAAGTAQVLVERGIIKNDELDKALGFDDNDANSEGAFQVGDEVQVLEEHLLSRWRKPHLRTPGYIFGGRGTVERCCGPFHDPEFLAFRGSVRHQHLYRVRFSQKEVWPEYDGPAHDTVVVEIYESWLKKGDGKAQTSGDAAADSKRRRVQPSSTHHHKHGHDHDHNHDHGHDHVHEERSVVEQKAVDQEGPERPGRRLAEALAKVVTSKGIISTDALRRAVEKIDAAGTNMEGPRMVARAWIDPAFKSRLLKDGTSAAAELGIAAANATAPTVFTVVESTPTVHNLIVCTLCSCYPLSILGLPPPWYKSREYRARAVRQPRKLLAESFGLNLPEDVTIEVHDSTADLRYMVLPKRPTGTEGWSEEQLQKLVTRDTLLGVAVPTVN
eukprot:TRINITY_DN16557_c0_g1_i1.p1 TRINITY_DN16557_c0_g1~~TRINITY_DN16557_c0_g1_i1.p1  ORF type:complete len:486 (-),score=68.20 TRINITY_DN16557_c0_g1_i1:360-1817(-)